MIKNNGYSYNFLKRLSCPTNRFWKSKMSPKPINSSSKYCSQAQVWICTSIKWFNLKVADITIWYSRWTCSSQWGFSVLFSPALVRSTPCIRLNAIVATDQEWLNIRKVNKFMKMKRKRTRVLVGMNTGSERKLEPVWKWCCKCQNRGKMMQNTSHELLPHFGHSMPRGSHENIFSVLPQTEMNMGTGTNIFQWIPRQIYKKHFENKIHRSKGLTKSHCAFRWWTFIEWKYLGKNITTTHVSRQSVNLSSCFIFLVVTSIKTQKKRKKIIHHLEKKSARTWAWK